MGRLPFHVFATCTALSAMCPSVRSARAFTFPSHICYIPTLGLRVSIRALRIPFKALSHFGSVCATVGHESPTCQLHVYR